MPTNPSAVVDLAVPAEVFADCAQLVQKLDEGRIVAGPRASNEMKMQITQHELSEHEALIRELLAKCEEPART